LKRVLLVAFTMLMLCSLLLANAGIAKAGNDAYPIIEHWAAEATIDGEWSAGDEWTDGQPMNMSGNARFVFKLWYSAMAMQWLVEFFDDNTTDAGDLWQICLDDSNGGGAAPQAGDFMIEIEGHTTLKTYQGNGAGWIEFTLSDPNEITWVNKISASPWNSTPHWIVEISDVKTGGEIQVGNPPPTGMRVAAYDANTTSWASWAPDSDADVPDEWGVIAGYSQNPYPEGFSIVFVVLLSSVAVAVGFYFVRKRPKLKALV
jgi:hypothetical protein